jgi:hypothetical protein
MSTQLHHQKPLTKTKTFFHSLFMKRYKGELLGVGKLAMANNIGIQPLLKAALSDSTFDVNHPVGQNCETFLCCVERRFDPCRTQA